MTKEEKKTWMRCDDVIEDEEDGFLFLDASTFIINYYYSPQTTLSD